MSEKKLKITKKRLVQDSYEYGSDDDHMISRAIFDVEYNDFRE